MGIGVAGDVEEVFWGEGEEVLQRCGAEAGARRVDDGGGWGVVLSEGGQERTDVPFVNLHVSDAVEGAVGLGVVDGIR